LRVAVVEGEPTGLDLHHDAVAGQEDVAGVALRCGGRRGWHCWESREPTMRNELSTIPSSGQCEPTSPEPPARVADWQATCSPPHGTSRGASRTANSHADSRP